MNLLRIILLGSALGTLTILTPSAIAQSTNYDNAAESYSFRVKIGAFFPTESVVIGLNPVWLALGADVVGKGYFGPHSQTFFSVDLFNRTGGGRQGTIVPINIGQIIRFGAADDEAPRFYAGAGIGLVVGDYNGSSSNKFGGKLLLGVEFNDNVFAEAAYFLTDRFKDSGTGISSRANGITVSLGWHF